MRWLLYNGGVALRYDQLVIASAITTSGDKKGLSKRFVFSILGILSISPEERRRRLEAQARENKWHQFVDGELILKQGLVDKRKGLFARRRMLLLTTGPRLFYVDPVNMVLKGEIPWSPELRVEAKNFRIFLVHTVS